MKKVLAILLALVMVLSVFAACGKKPAKKEENQKPLVVGYSNFSQKFSPFFAESAYDQDVAKMTSVYLLGLDRQGAIVELGKTGETRPYNGKDYKYEGPADLKITENKDGTVDYDFELRDNIKFSDGEKLTVDDVIFSMYVLSDPTYDGSDTFFALPIKGMEEYRAGMASLLSLMYAAGRDNTDFTNWTEEDQTKFWEDLDKAGAAFVQEIVDFCIANGYNAEGDSPATCIANWGFEAPEDATTQDIFYIMVEAYEGDLTSLSSTESAGSSLADLGFDPADYAKGIKTGDSAENIEGIKKTGENSFKVTLTKVDAAAIYQLGIVIAPLHYYG
nr:ABC transporter substrate-binding protein [Clostridiales bacterium]